MKKIKKLITSKPFVLSLLLLLLVSSFIPVESGTQTALEKIMMTSGLGKLNSVADTYIENQKEKALKVFAIFTGVKTLLALIRSSEVDFVFSIRPGAIANAVYDYINFGWKILLAATVYYYVSDVFLSSVRAVDVTFLRLLLVVILVGVACRWWLPAANRTATLLKQISVYLSVAVILLYFVVPFTFVGGNWISDKITDEPIDKAASAIESAHEKLRDRFPKFDSKETDPGNVDGVQERIREDDSTVLENNQPTHSPVVTDEVSNEGMFSNTLSKVNGLLLDDLDETPGSQTQGVKQDEGDQTKGWFTSVRETLNIGNKVVLLKEDIAEFSGNVVRNVLKVIAAYIFNIIVFPVLLVFGFYWFAKSIIVSPITSQLLNILMSPSGGHKNVPTNI